MEGESYPGVEKGVSGLIETLRDHIWKEENTIYRIAQERLAGKDMEAVSRKMEGFRR